MIIDLGNPGVLRLTGSDTPRFCNSMLTNAFRRPGQGGHSGMADSKGRLLALLDAWCLAPDQALLVIDGADVEEVARRLDMYIIMDPIELEDLTSSHGIVHVVGEDSAAILEAHGLPVPDGIVAHGGGWIAATDRCGLSGFDLIGVSLGPDTSVEVLEGLRIQAGLPRWPVDFGERAFVHEMGLRDRICAFDKGCYVGQEVINRMDTMGKVNKRLTGLVVDGEGSTGGAVLLGEDQLGVVSSEATVDGRTLALAVLRPAAWEPGTELGIATNSGHLSARSSRLPFE
ncbi:MAG TPA: hypothetical protein QGF58_05345 [Myxococcota bacterium]|nr:hypothetical protein [Myxococcota bacterium]